MCLNTQLSRSLVVLWDTCPCINAVVRCEGLGGLDHWEILVISQSVLCMSICRLWLQCPRPQFGSWWLLHAKTMMCQLRNCFGGTSRTCTMGVVEKHRMQNWLIKKTTLTLKGQFTTTYYILVFLFIQLIVNVCLLQVIMELALLVFLKSTKPHTHGG